MWYMKHSLAVLGICEALVGCTLESSPEEIKNKRDAEDYCGNNFGFGKLVICIVRKDIFFPLEREREQQKGHGNSIPVTQ